MNDKYAKSISVRVTSDDYKLLQSLKESRGITPSQLVRDALLKHRVDLFNNHSPLNDEL